MSNDSYTQAKEGSEVEHVLRVQTATSVCDALISRAHVTYEIVDMANSDVTQAPKGRSIFQSQGVGTSTLH